MKRAATGTGRTIMSWWPVSTCTDVGGTVIFKAAHSEQCRRVRVERTGLAETTPSLSLKLVLAELGTSPLSPSLLLRPATAFERAVDAMSTPHRLDEDRSRGTRSIALNGWTITSTKRPILSIPEADA